MKVIGLTGGIGSGKSLASEYLKGKGCGIIDADIISRDIVKKGEPVLKELVDFFGKSILNEDETLNRKKLADLVFHDVKKREVLDEIMHKNIHKVVRAKVWDYGQSGKYPVTFIDAPLLFETGLHEDCEAVWLIVADQETRIQRVCKRDGLTEDEVRARINNQMDDKEKKKMTDIVIDNTGTEEQLFARLDELLEQNC